MVEHVFFITFKDDGTLTSCTCLPEGMAENFLKINWPDQTSLRVTEATFNLVRPDLHKYRANMDGTVTLVQPQLF